MTIQLVRTVRRLLTAALFMPVSLLYGQSITLSPAGYQSVAPKGQIQFTATVTGLSNTAVAWSVESVNGGNATSGTVTASGLYTAPTSIPGQDPVEITATSVAQPSLSTSTYVDIIPAGPTLSSVSPNPLPTGQITVTLTGTGFLSGVTVTETYNGNSINLATTAVTATTITATVWQPAEPNTTFTVTNSGTMPSNGVTVPVGGSSSSGYTLTVVNGSGGGTYASGATASIQANAPPAGKVFKDWTGATVAAPTSAGTTMTMPAANTTVTANFGSPPNYPPVPFPVTTHPRLWITTADLPKLQNWAKSSNPIYAQGMVPLLQQVLSAYNTQYFPGGQPNPNYPDDGDINGYASSNSEEFAVVLAFNSLIAPNPKNRITYAQDARNLLMHVMNQAALGTLASAPFRDPLFCQSNRSNYYGEDWGLIVDWLYNAKDATGANILTASDKTTIRQVFLMWANILLTADATGGDHPVPVGLTNNLALIGNGSAAYRFASNNYYLGHARLMTMMALSFDPADDPAINPSLSLGYPGNSLRSFLYYANGAWLYQEYAMMGDPASVAKDYGIAGVGNGLGLASGGTPPEGVLYGHSFGYVLGQLLALQTAGFNNASYTGKQAHLIGSPVWGRYVQSFLSALTPTSHMVPNELWLGPIYQWATSGDTLRTWVTPEQMIPISLLGLLEQHEGVTTDTNAARWFAQTVPQGGLMYNVSTPFTWSTSQSLFAYMLFDPTTGPPTDPRPSFPLVFFDQPQGQIYARTDWSLNPTWFDYRASWESINHMQGDGGQFEFFRNGEWLTRGMSNYDSNWLGQTTMYHNTLGIHNWCSGGTPQLNWFEAGEWANGSQWNLGLNQGDPKTEMSTGVGYVYATSDLTKLYNRPEVFLPASALLDVTQASRQILWLQPDTIVIYDRATTKHPDLFKTFNLSLVNAPVVSGNVATETMGSGQRLFIQTVLPKAPLVSTINGAASLDSVSDLEPTQFVMQVQDPTLPLSARFLDVLQAADKGYGMVQAAFAKQESGTPFDGAVFGTTAVFFPHNSGAVATTKFAQPFAHGTVMIAGLTSNASYGVTVSAGAIMLVPGGTGIAADVAGLLTVKF